MAPYRSISPSQVVRCLPVSCLPVKSSPTALLVTEAALLVMQWATLLSGRPSSLASTRREGVRHAAQVECAPTQEVLDVASVGSELTVLGSC